MSLTSSQDKSSDRHAASGSRLPERFVNTTCPPRLDQPPSREAGLAELEKLNISPERRRILNLLFARAWPANLEAGAKPESWIVWISVKQLGAVTGELKRTATKEHLDSLIVSRLVDVATKPGKPSGWSINWNTIYGIHNAIQKDPAPSGLTGVDPSAPSGFTHPTPPPHPEALDEFGTCEPEGAEGSSRRGRMGSGGGVDRQTRILRKAIYKIGNHLANRICATLEQGFRELAQRGTQPEGAEGATPLRTPPPPPDSLNLNSTVLNSINTNSIQFKGDPSDGGPNKVRWPHPWRNVLPDELSDDTKLNAIFDDVVKVAGWPPGDAGRRELFALAEYSAKSKKVKPVSAFIGGIKQQKFGPNRRAEPWAFKLADERLQKIAATQHARDHPEAAAELAAYLRQLDKPDALELLKGPDNELSFAYQHFARSTETVPKEMTMTALVKAVGNRSIPVLEFTLNQARKLRVSSDTRQTAGTIS